MTRADWTSQHVHALLAGDTFGVFGRVGCETTPAERDAIEQRKRDCWSDVRADVLPGFIELFPGRRPVAWWAFDAPERRERVDGKRHPFENEERQAKVREWEQSHPAIAKREAYKLNHGKPACLMTADDFMAEYESETDYLERLELMDASELAAVETGEPTTIRLSPMYIADNWGFPSRAMA